MSISLEIDQDIYSKKVINTTREAFGRFCSISVLPLPRNRCLIKFFIKTDYEAETRQIVLEFMNYALDCAAQED